MTRTIPAQRDHLDPTDCTFLCQWLPHPSKKLRVHRLMNRCLLCRFFLVSQLPLGLTPVLMVGGCLAGGDVASDLLVLIHVLSHLGVAMVLLHHAVPEMPLSVRCLLLRRVARGSLLQQGVVAAVSPIVSPR